jgi:hypothetical protein
MSDDDSLVKAKYALTILKVARTVERKTSAQLVEGLATDFPAHDDRPEVAQAHKNATEIFGKLADAIRGPAGGSPHLWDTAFRTVEYWRRTIE